MARNILMPSLKRRSGAAGRRGGGVLRCAWFPACAGM